MKLAAQWNARLNLIARADKLWNEADKLWDESHAQPDASGRFCAEIEKQRARADARRAEADKLWAEANAAWLDAVIKAHGNIGIEWKWRNCVADCILANGDVYAGDATVVEHPILDRMGMHVAAIAAVLVGLTGWILGFAPPAPY